MSHRPGVDLSLTELLALRTSRRRRSLPTQPTADIDGQVASQKVSRGLDIAEIRQYQAGDDVRSIDWKVTARRGATHVKVYEDERASAVYLLVDVRSCMHFGTRVCLKSVLAARLAAALGWQAHSAGDRVGAWVVSDLGIERVSDSAQERAVRRLCHTLVRHHAAAPSDSGAPSLAEAMDGIASGQFAKAEWHVISDFSDDSVAAPELKRLNGVCWHVTDPLDIELPKRVGWIRDHLSQRRLSSRARDRAAHAARYRARADQLRVSLGRPGQHYCQISTVDGEGLALQRALAARGLR